MLLALIWRARVKRFPAVLALQRVQFLPLSRNFTHARNPHFVGISRNPENERGTHPDLLTIVLALAGGPPCLRKIWWSRARQHPRSSENAGFFVTV